MSNTENNYQETDLGNVSPNPRGEYDPSAEYEYLDLVSYQGGSYLCLAEFETKITGTAPEAGKNTDYWQLVTLPGDLTPEYIAMHDDTIAKAKQTEASRTAAELAQEAAETARTDVVQMHSETLQAATEARENCDSSAGYAQAAELSRKAAAESEQNINAQVTGFETEVSESVTQATEQIATARQKAVQTITSQQDTSVQAVKDQTAAYISEKNTEAKKEITDHAEQEIVRINAQDSVQQIQKNKEDVALLKEDIGNMATVVRLTDIIKDKPFGYCKGVDDKSFVGNVLTGTFATGDFVEIGQVDDLYLKSGKTYRIVYRVTEIKEDIVIQSMKDYMFKNAIKGVTVSNPIGFVDFTADSDLNLAISNSGTGANVLKFELYAFDITGIADSVLNLIDWMNTSHNMHRVVVTKSLDSNHAKNADYAKIAEKLLSDSDNDGLKPYKSRNLLDVSKITKGLLTNGNIEKNDSYVTTDYINISDVNNIVSYCNDDRTDMPFNIISFYDNEQAHIRTIVNWDSGMLAYSKTDMPDNAIFARLSYYKDYFGEYYNYQMIENGDVKTHWQAYFNAYKSSEVQPMFDKIIDTLGDSITEQMKWQKYIADNLHTGTIFNHGIGGTRISGNNANSMWQDVRINALDNNIDCLLIMGGTNDSAQNATIGELSRENTDTNTFVGAYNVLLSKIFYKYYHLGSGFSGIIQTEKINPIQIMIATPIYCNNSDYGNMDNIATAVRGISDMWGIPIADLHRKSGINSITSSIYLADDVHPNSDGGKRVANVWINALKTNSNLII